MNICLQFLGTSPPDPHRGSAAGPRWRVPPSRPTAACPAISKFLSTPLVVAQYKPTQPSITPGPRPCPGSVNEDQLRPGRQRQAWFIPFVNKRVDGCWQPAGKQRAPLLTTRAMPERFCSAVPSAIESAPLLADLDRPGWATAPPSRSSFSRICFRQHATRSKYC